MTMVALQGLASPSMMEIEVENGFKIMHLPRSLHIIRVWVDKQFYSTQTRTVTVRGPGREKTHRKVCDLGANATTVKAEIILQAGDTVVFDVTLGHPVHLTGVWFDAEGATPKVIEQEDGSIPYSLAEIETENGYKVMHLPRSLHILRRWKKDLLSRAPTVNVQEVGVMTTCRSISYSFQGLDTTDIVLRAGTTVVFDAWPKTCVQLTGVWFDAENQTPQ